MKILSFHSMYLEIVQERDKKSKKLPFRYEVELRKKDKLMEKIIKELNNVNILDKSSSVNINIRNLAFKLGKPPNIIGAKVKELNNLGNNKEKRKDSGILNNVSCISDYYTLFKFSKKPGFLVEWITVEKNDTNEEVIKMAEEIIKIANNIGIKKIILIPFIHLSNKYSEDKEQRKTLFNTLKNYLSDRNFQIELIEEYVNKYITISASGHRFGIVFRSIPK